jgi:hypothetical protein
MNNERPMEMVTAPPRDDRALADHLGHSLREQRSQTAGVIYDSLRLLRNALAAANADPPRIAVIRERLEDVIADLQKHEASLHPH